MHLIKVNLRLRMMRAAAGKMKLGVNFLLAIKANGSKIKRGKSIYTITL